ncbi:MAG: hypothetical protein DHS20C18_32550 [Saprospiraceae bacterium]|nr:MAG: hypothetical protein DHS20C18_32550 [Saprospiraceae bacterium]
MEADQDLWIGTTGGLVHYAPDSETPTFYNRGNSGLPGNWVTDVEKSSDGRIWVATTKGMAIYDGTNWIRHDSIRSAQLALMNNGEIAAAVPSKLYLSSGNDLSVYEYEGCGYEVTDIAVNPVNGDIWIVAYTFGCVDLNRFDGTEWTRYYYSNSTLPFESPTDNSVVVDQEGTVWVGTWGGLNRFQNEEWEQIDLSDLVDPLSAIYSLRVAANGDLWGIVYSQQIDGQDFSTQLLRYDGTDWATFPISDGLVQNYQTPVFLPGDQQYYLGTQGKGLYGTDLATFSGINTSNSPLPGNRVQPVIRKEEEMWIGTNTIGHSGNAVVQINGDQWTDYDPEYPINLRLIDPQGKIWVSSDQYLYYTLENEVWTPVDFTALGAPDLEGIANVAFDQEDNLWIFGNIGVARFDGNDWTTFSTGQTGIINGAYMGVAFDPANNDLWIGTYYGVKHYNGQQWRDYAFQGNGIVNLPAVFAFAFGQEGEVYAGAQSGLFVKDGPVFSLLSGTGLTQVPYGIQSLFMDADGDLWGGSLDALIRYNDGIQNKYTPQNSGLPDGRILAINQDANGNLWLGTESGLGLFNENGVIWENPHTANENMLPQLELKISPNPVAKSEHLQVQLPGNVSGNLHARLLDIQGRQIWAANVTASNDQFLVDLNTLNLVSGMYIIQVHTDTGMGAMKLVVE